MSKIIESKVAFGAAAGGIGGAVASFLLWLLGITLWHAPAAAGSADVATAAVPAPVAGLLLTLLPGVFALIGGYLAPHTRRPDLTTTTAPEVSAPVVIPTPPTSTPVVRVTPYVISNGTGLVNGPAVSVPADPATPPVA